MIPNAATSPLSNIAIADIRLQSWTTNPLSVPEFPSVKIWGGGFGLGYVLRAAEVEED